MPVTRSVPRAMTSLLPASPQPSPRYRALPVLVLASITESVVNETAHLVRTGGLPMIFALMALGSACIPVPSEVVMLFAGFAVADKVESGAHHHLTLLGVVLAGLLGTLVGSWVAYAVGRGGRLELLERHGGKVHMGPAQIQRADRWFQRYGEPIVLFGRLIPLLRAFVSLPAGIARMPLLRFTVLTLIGSLPWVLGAGDRRSRRRRRLDERSQGLRVRRLRRARADRDRRRLSGRAPTRPERARRPAEPVEPVDARDGVRVFNDAG